MFAEGLKLKIAIALEDASLTETACAEIAIACQKGIAIMT